MKVYVVIAEFRGLRPLARVYANKDVAEAKAQFLREVSWHHVRVQEQEVLED
jgi:hypothetical protein